MARVRALSSTTATTALVVLAVVGPGLNYAAQWYWQDPSVPQGQRLTWLAAGLAAVLLAAAASIALGHAAQKSTAKRARELKAKTTWTHAPRPPRTKRGRLRIRPGPANATVPAVLGVLAWLLGWVPLVLNTGSGWTVLAFLSALVGLVFIGFGIMVDEGWAAGLLGFPGFFLLIVGGAFLPLDDPAFWYWFGGQLALTVLAIVLVVRGRRRRKRRQWVIRRLRHGRWIGYDDESDLAQPLRDLVTPVLRLPAARFKAATRRGGLGRLLIANGNRIAVVVDEEFQARWRLSGRLDDITHNRTLYAEDERDAAASLAKVREVDQRVPGAKVCAFVLVPATERDDQLVRVDPGAPPVLFTDEAHLADAVTRFLGGARPVLRVPVLHALSNLY
ncbi:hypothetical protein AB0B28_02405 [Glycomyces sp. NPDC046736]|uniref:hypothetical protein n=1 Tax=Glycomyces sp. NPDC046736 TaxID=3155615 RepID=UPI00340B128A